MPKPKHTPLPWRRRLGGFRLSATNAALAEQIRSIREENARSVVAISDWLAGKSSAAKADESRDTGRSDPHESSLP